MDEDAINKEISDLCIFLTLEEHRQADTFDLKCAVEAVSKMINFRNLQIRAGFSKPQMTEIEAVEIMLQTFQDYKSFLSFKAEMS